MDLTTQEDIAAQAQSIIERYEALISEYTIFRDALLPNLQPPESIWRHNNITKAEAELSVTQRLRDCADPSRCLAKDEVDRLRVKLTSTNVGAIEAVWHVTKNLEGVVGMDRKIKIGTPPSGMVKANGETKTKNGTPLSGIIETRKEPGRLPEKKPERLPNNGQPDDLVMLHAIADGGATWVRVVQTPEKTLAWNMAECGWRYFDDEDDDCDYDALELVKIANELIQASSTNRFRHHCPRVRLVLTKIREGPDVHIDRLLNVIRGMARDGVEVTVEAGNSPFVLSPIPSIEEALPRMVKQPTPDLGDIINIDISALIMLLSDITHRHCKVEEWQHRAHKAEIELENANPGLCLSAMIEAMAGKKLICVRAAYEKVLQISGTVAQEVEKRRVDLVFDTGRTMPLSPDERVARFQELSDYPAALQGLHLPIEVIEDEPWDDDRVQYACKERTLPSVAAEVCGAWPNGLWPLGRAIFLYGWATGHTTVTSNVFAANRFADLSEKHRTSNDEKGPKIHVFGMPRGFNSTRKLKASNGQADEA